MADFRVNETTDTVTVEVTVTEPPTGKKNKNPEAVVLDDVLFFLAKKDIEVDKCTQKVTVSNMGKNPNLQGSFVFTKKSAKKQEVEEANFEEKLLKEDEDQQLEESPEELFSTDDLTETSKPTKKKKSKKRKKVYSEYSE
jgi:hypothetical protein